MKMYENKWNVELLNKNENKKPVVAIGDVHGLTKWKDIVEEHEDCTIVFLGDYLDPYEYITREQQLANLSDIIGLKKERMDSVVLLLGNHDLHYFCEKALPGSRYDFQIEKDAEAMFCGNIELFQYAFQQGNFIFTHAGIQHSWFVNDFKGDLSKPIADQLNSPKPEQLDALFRLGRARGGRIGDIGGIFWADISELTDPLHGYTQIVGHNRVDDITERMGHHDNKIIFCDCLFKGKTVFLTQA